MGSMDAIPLSVGNNKLLWMYYILLLRVCQPEEKHIGKIENQKVPARRHSKLGFVGRHKLSLPNPQ